MDICSFKAAFVAGGFRLVGASGVVDKDCACEELTGEGAAEVASDDGGLDPGAFRFKVDVDREISELFSGGVGTTTFGLFCAIF